jgi:hypothetical protein
LQLRFEARNQTRHDCGNITPGASQGLRQHECRDQSEAPRAQTALNHFKRSRVCLTVEHRNRHRTEEHGAGFLLLEDDVVAHSETISVQRLHLDRAVAFSKSAKPALEQFIGLNCKKL